MSDLRQESTFAAEVRGELERARRKFPPINSLHEGYAVILEELDEFFDEVRAQDLDGRLRRAYRELIQIAAMAQRTAEDCISHENAARPVTLSGVGGSHDDD